VTDLHQLQAAIRGEVQAPSWWVGEPLPMDPVAPPVPMPELRAFLVYDKRQPYGPPELVLAEEHCLAVRYAMRRHHWRDQRHLSVRLRRP
jgi:hypothetical protein